jgi:hypothetical protein
MKFESRGRVARTRRRIVLRTIRRMTALSLRRSEHSSTCLNAMLHGVFA